MPSKFFRFKQDIVFFLEYREGWTYENSLKFLSSYQEELRELHKLGATPSSVARAVSRGKI